MIRLESNAACSESLLFVLLMPNAPDLDGHRSLSERVRVRGTPVLPLPLFRKPRAHEPSSL